MILIVLVYVIIGFAVSCHFMRFSSGIVDDAIVKVCFVIGWPCVIAWWVFDLSLRKIKGGDL